MQQTKIYRFFQSTQSNNKRYTKLRWYHIYAYLKDFLFDIRVLTGFWKFKKKYRLYTYIFFENMTHITPSNETYIKCVYIKLIVLNVKINKFENNLTSIKEDSTVLGLREKWDTLYIRKVESKIFFFSRKIIIKILGQTLVV